MITVQLATGKEHAIEADGWAVAEGVLTVTRAGELVASFRNWLSVETEEPLPARPPPAPRRKGG